MNHSLLDGTAASLSQMLHPETLALFGTGRRGGSGAVKAQDGLYPFAGAPARSPAQHALEERLAAFEGGASALALASGQAASAFSVLNVAEAGDNFVTSTGLYGGTWVLFANTLRDLGVEARFVDPSDPENFHRATDSRTRLYYAETLPNPKLHMFPIAEVA